jgi:hypothetical protein
VEIVEPLAFIVTLCNGDPSFESVTLPETSLFCE